MVTDIAFTYIRSSMEHGRRMFHTDRVYGVVYRVYVGRYNYLAHHPATTTNARL